MSENINHPVLGTVTWNMELGCWESEVELRSGCLISLCLTVLMEAEPTKKTDELLRAGVEMLEWARRCEPKCRQRIVDELLQLYNERWAPDAMAGDPETAKGLMSRAEFIQWLTPTSLVLDIDGSGFFYWDIDDLFAGHYIMVRFSKDRNITEVGLAG
jgi:hypothetical protein